MLHLSSNLGIAATPVNAARVLMIDVGGTNVKLMVSGCEEMLKFPSGRGLSAAQMVEQTLQLTSAWSYDCISIGFPYSPTTGIVVKTLISTG